MKLDDLRSVTLGELAALMAPSSSAATPDRYVDLKTSGAYRHALTAIDAGELPAFRLPGSRKLWVKADDFRAWIERDAHRSGAKRPLRLSILLKTRSRSSST